MQISPLSAFAADAKRMRDEYFPQLGRESGSEADLATFGSMLRRKATLEADGPTRASMLLFADGAEEFLAAGDINLPIWLGKAMEFDLPQSQVSKIIKSLNEAYIYERSLELTSHGICRSFRFWSENEKRDYLRKSQELLEFIKGDFPLACMGYGFVLSFVRHQDFMQHDDDIDIIIALDAAVYPSIASGVAALTKRLTGDGWTVWGNFPSHRKVHIKDTDKDVDVFLGYHEGDFVSFLPGPRKTIRYETVFPALDVSLLDTKIQIPRNPFQYLQDVYGPHWFTPMPGWQHSWREADYADILGI